MRILKNFPIKGKHTKSIITDLYFNKNNNQKPLVIFCHGYKGYKDWGAFDLMSSSFLKAGFVLNAEDYLYSSAIDYSDEKGLIEQLKNFFIFDKFLR